MIRFMWFLRYIAYFNIYLRKGNFIFEIVSFIFGKSVISSDFAIISIFRQNSSVI